MSQIDILPYRHFTVDGLREELRRRGVARVANKDACRAVAIDSMGSGKAAKGFSEYIAPRLSGAGIPGLAAVGGDLLGAGGG